MKVNIKKLTPEATTPTYAKEGDAGMDLTATSVKETDMYVEYGTGLAFELPKGFVGLLFQRSSVSKYHLSLANAVGVLDSGYRGEVSFRFKKTPNHTPLEYSKRYEIGDKIGQIMIIPYPKVEFTVTEQLLDSERGTGSYGSSGV
jgi:dUTP pyrophosphatase